MRRLQFGTASQPRSGARRDLREERFAAFFPRLFAYACAATGDAEAARDVAVTAFTSVFSMPDMREAEFEVALFKETHEICSVGEFRVRRYNDGLSPREREIISLVFDAQLDQAKIVDLLGIRDDAVTTTLTRGLRKLRTRLGSETTGSVAPSFS